MDADLDKRTKRGRELANRLNHQTVIDNMPKIYFVVDKYNEGYRVGRTDWPGDCFSVIPKAEFEAFRAIYEAILSMPLIEKTDDED